MQTKTETSEAEWQTAYIMNLRFCKEFIPIVIGSNLPTDSVLVSDSDFFLPSLQFLERAFQLNYSDQIQSKKQFNTEILTNKMRLL